MNKLTIHDVDFAGKRTLMRVDFNVPLDGAAVSDDTRIRAALPSIRHILDKGASRLILMSHLGRPSGKPNPEMSLKPAALCLEAMLGRPVAFLPDCVGENIKKAVDALPIGSVVLLENLRFHAEEEGKAKAPETATAEEKAAAKAEMKKRQKAFAAQIAALGDIYVNDAFGTAHRPDASMVAVAEHFQSRAAGFLMDKEIKYIGGVLENPRRPFIAIIGGAKIGDKIDVISNLLTKCDAILIGGGMAYTFYRAKGLPIGKSLLEADKVELAASLLKKADEMGVKLLLPVDNVVADRFAEDAARKVVGESIQDGWMALDIGPKTVQRYVAEIAKAKTVMWNGPMGCFEMTPFAEGTYALCKALAAADCVSIIGGGDSVSAVQKSGLADKMSHVSTGGGASLEFMEGKSLPGIAALTDAK